MPRCDICNYYTLRMDNLIRHYNTKKHIEQMKQIRFGLSRS